MNGNDFVKFFLRTPLHIFMGNTLLLTLTGRKSGKPVSLPVNFHLLAGVYWVTSRRNRTWWRNISANPAVTVLLHGKTAPARAELLLDEKEVANQLGKILSTEVFLAKALGVRLEANKAPNPADLARVAAESVLVKIILQ
jgi:deazaflavin-dependent oxidoreductase (nitroreductase family)